MQNIYKPKFTYVIPFQFKPDRILNLRRVVDLLAGFQGSEVLIVEQDRNSKLESLNLRSSHIFVETDVPFNKSWLYNIAIQRTNTPIIIFGESDVVINPNFLIEALKSIETLDCVFPMNQIINLSHMESQMDFNSVMSVDRLGFKKNLCDGISIFKRDSIKRIGGWNEDIIGLDGSDNKIQDIKIKKMLNWKELDHKAYHLFHNPFPEVEELKKRNYQIVDFFINYNLDQIQQQINMSFPKIGMNNKYSQL